jgi:hypothetical protein
MKSLSIVQNSWDCLTKPSELEEPADSVSPAHPSYPYYVPSCHPSTSSYPSGILLLVLLQKALLPANYYCELTMHHQTSSCARWRDRRLRMVHQRCLLLTASL